MTAPRFIADEMNGDLAKWLRILGYDCLYPKGSEGRDKDIIEKAKQSGRIVLTSDKKLYSRCLREDVEAVNTSCMRRVEKLSALMERYGLHLSWEARPPRCSLCSILLIRVERAEVADKVPRGVTRRYNEFWRCPSCRKVYWEGTHWKGILDLIEKAKKHFKRPTVT